MRKCRVEVYIIVIAELHRLIRPGTLTSLFQEVTKDHEDNPLIFKPEHLLKFLMRCFPAVLPGLLLTSCITYYGNVSSVSKVNPQKGNGVIIVSLTTTGSQPIYYYYADWFFRPITGDGRRGSLEMKTFFVSNDWEHDPDDTLGHLHVIELPAGDYQLFYWRGSAPSAVVFLKSSNSIQFTVEPGAVRYIGNIDLGQNVRILDMHDRDLALAAKKYPDLDRSKVDISISRNCYPEGKLVKYDGPTRNNLPDGIGKAVFQDGSEFEGTFVMGRPTFPGTRRSPDGTKEFCPHAPAGLDKSIK